MLTSRSFYFLWCFTFVSSCLLRLSSYGSCESDSESLNKSSTSLSSESRLSVWFSFLSSFWKPFDPLRKRSSSTKQAISSSICRIWSLLGPVAQSFASSGWNSNSVSSPLLKKFKLSGSWISFALLPAKKLVSFSYWARSPTTVSRSSSKLFLLSLSGIMTALFASPVEDFNDSCLEKKTSF